MVILAYDVQGVILFHFVPDGETVNAQYAYYAAYLQKHLCHAVRHKRPQLQNVIILHDNATPHKARGGKYWSIHHTHQTFRLVIMI